MRHDGPNDFFPKAVFFDLTYYSLETSENLKVSGSIEKKQRAVMG